MRILACNYEFPPLGGGGGNALKYLSREWLRAGHQVTVVTSNWRPRRSEEEVDGVRVIRVPVRRERMDFSKVRELAAYIWSGRREVRKLVRSGERWDVVLSVFVMPSGLVGDLAARLLGVPHVVRIGGGDIPGHEKRLSLLHRLVMPLTRRLLLRAGIRVANSRGLKERAENTLGLTFAVVENGVDLCEFFPAPEGPVHDPPAVLSVSRLIERKGIQFLLRAAATLKDRGFDFRLLVAGDGPMRPALEKMAAELGVAKIVEWLGAVEHQRIPEVYRRADVFVLPSLSEGMSNAALEAAACGLPLILTKVPGTDELVVDGANGLVVSPGDVGALVEALANVLRDPETRRRMGQASRKRAERWSWPSLAQRYIDLFQEAIAAAQCRSTRRG